MRCRKRLEVEVKRDGKVHRIVFAGGDVAEKLQGVGTVRATRTGTTVRVWPDPKYFDSPKCRCRSSSALLRSKAVLMPGVTVTLLVEKGKDSEDADLAVQGRPARLPARAGATG